VEVDHAPSRDVDRGSIGPHHRRGSVLTASHHTSHVTRPIPVANAFTGLAYNPDSVPIPLPPPLHPSQHVHTLNMTRLTALIRSTSRVVAPRPVAVRTLYTSPIRFTTAGYGDPQDEKADNHTPTPASSADPKPKGQGKGPKTKSGTTDPEVKPKSKSSSSKSKGTTDKSTTKTDDAMKKTGNAGGDGGKRSKKTPDEKEIKETKKVGEAPKKEEVDGAGPIGG